MSAVFRGGLLSETEANSGITRLVAKSLLKGTKTRTAEQIAESTGSSRAARSRPRWQQQFRSQSRCHSTGSRARHRHFGRRVAQRYHAALKRWRAKKRSSWPKSKMRTKSRLRWRAIWLSELFFRDIRWRLRPEGTPESVARLDSKDLLAFRDRYIVARNGVIAVFRERKSRASDGIVRAKTGRTCLQVNSR